MLDVPPVPVNGADMPDSKNRKRRITKAQWDIKESICLGAVAFYDAVHIVQEIRHNNDTRVVALFTSYKGRDMRRHVVGQIIQHHYGHRYDNLKYFLQGARMAERYKSLIDVCAESYLLNK